MNEEIFEEELSEDDINKIIKQWKEEYGEIYVTTIDGESFIYRLMSYKEYTDLKNISEDNFHLEELVCKEAVLDPIVDYSDDIYAGYTSSLAIDILTQSYIIVDEKESLTFNDKIEEKYIELQNDTKAQIPLIIKHCFQEYTLNEIENMPIPKQLDLFNKARWMLDVLEGNPITFDTEEQV